MQSDPASAHIRIASCVSPFAVYSNSPILYIPDSPYSHRQICNPHSIPPTLQHCSASTLLLTHHQMKATCHLSLCLHNGPTRSPGHNPLPHANRLVQQHSMRQRMGPPARCWLLNESTCMLRQRCNSAAGTTRYHTRMALSICPVAHLLASFLALNKSFGRCNAKWGLADDVHVHAQTIASVVCGPWSVNVAGGTLEDSCCLAHGMETGGGVIFKIKPRFETQVFRVWCSAFATPT